MFIFTLFFKKIAVLNVTNKSSFIVIFLTILCVPSTDNLVERSYHRQTLNFSETFPSTLAKVDCGEVADGKI